MIAALLLSSAAAFAQPVVGPEVVSDPVPLTLATPLPAPAVAMARDRLGVAIAWTVQTVGSRIYVARLDASGQIAGSAREVPLFDRSAEAMLPSLATSASGTGFTLAWAEITIGSNVAHAIVTQLDAELKPSQPVKPPDPAERPLTAPPIVRSGNGTWLTMSGLLWPIDPDGTAKGLFGAGMLVSDMEARGTDSPQLIGSHNVVTKRTYTCQPGCAVIGGPFDGYCYEWCRIYEDHYSYELQLAPSLFAPMTTKTFPFGSSEAQPALGSDGRDVLVVWFNGPLTAAGDIVAVRLPLSSFSSFDAGGQILGSFTADPGAARPDIAADGERYFVVWRGKSFAGDHDIFGASVDRQGQIIRLPIATSAADERDPSVIALGDGTFLVAYEKISAGERRIAGRFVTFGRRRATR
jgi:hypothetical protein